MRDDGAVVADPDRDMFVSLELERIRIECCVEASSCWKDSRGVGGGGETGGGGDGVWVEQGSMSCGLGLASVDMVSSSSSSSGPYAGINIGNLYVRLENEVETTSVS